MSINGKLKKVLIEMMGKDQEMRRSNLFNVELDKENTENLKRIIDEYGWPTISLVGEKASHGAWLITQHADFNVVFQKECLKLMRKAYKNKDVWIQDIAYLCDRVLVNSHKPQLFGTQFYINTKGQFVTRPIKNRHLLEQRRKKYKLTSFEEYQKLLTKIALKRHDQN